MSSNPAPVPAQASTPASAPARTAAAIISAAVLLVALALPAANRLVTTGLPRWLAIAAIALAVLTVLAGVGAVVLGGDGGSRPRRLLAGTAGVLLLGATALAGSATVAVLAGGPPPAAAAAEDLTVVISGVGDATLLTMRATMPDVAAGDLVRAEVTAGSPGGDQTVLARQLTVAGGAGPVSVTLVAPGVADHDMLRVLVESPDRRCTAAVRPLVSEAPVASCKAR